LTLLGVVLTPFSISRSDWLNPLCQFLFDSTATELLRVIQITPTD